MEIKVGTYNVLSCGDYKYYLETKTGRRDHMAFANAIRDLGLDICGLQEINNQEMLGGIHDSKFIAEQLGFYHVFARTLTHSSGAEYGIALVSRFPIVSTKFVPIHLPKEQRIEGRRGYEDRVILCAEILINEQVITVMCSHFGIMEEEIALAVDLLEECVKECKTPLLALGDFNMCPTSPNYAKLCTYLEDTAPLVHADDNTFASINPASRIDYIFKNDKIKLLSGKVPELVLSDHRPYMITIENVKAVMDAMEKYAYYFS